MMIENKASSFVEDSGRGFLCLVATGFLASQIFSYFGVEAVLYWVAVLVGVVYVFRRPGEGIWVTFFLLAITCLLYPITVSELGEPGAGDFRPYNFVIASMAGALVLNFWRRRRLLPPPPRRQSVTLKLALALVGVFCVATIYGDLSPLRAEALYVLQQCSTWISFFVFLWIGYKLALSPAEIQPAIRRFHLISLIYSMVFLAKFVYLSYDAGLIAATEFAYAQRMVLLFAGCSLALTVASMLAPEGRSPRKSVWLSVLIPLSAVVLSGSRGIMGALMLTLFVLATTWRTRSLLRLTPLLVATLLVGVVILQGHFQVVEEYVVNRFLITPDQDASLGGRVAEMEAVIEAVQRNPLLGSGTLASYMFFDPFFGWRESAFVDSGLGYLLLKTGLAGASVFVLLVLSYLKVLRRLRQSVAAYALIPLVVFVFYLAFLPFGPAFFDVKYSWLVGILCGSSLYLNKIYSEKTNLWATQMGADGNRSSRSYA
jgi:hypothetical protein